MAAVKPFILTYHSLDDSGSVISLAPQRFREQMEILRKSGIPVVPLDQIRSRPGAAALTFDDGYRNFHHFALPVLAEFGLPATVFLAAGLIGCEARWEGQSAFAAACRLMNGAELREARENGVRLAAHGLRHRDLTKLSDEEVIAEMEVSKETLAAHSGEVPKWFAYPYGACDARVRALAASRFELACGTDLRFVDPEADPLDLPRLDAYYFREIAKFEALVDGAAGNYVAFRRGLRRARSWLPRM